MIKKGIGELTSLPIALVQGNIHNKNLNDAGIEVTNHLVSLLPMGGPPRVCGTSAGTSTRKQILAVQLEECLVITHFGCVAAHVRHTILVDALLRS